MPRHGRNYDDDLDDARGKFDDDMHDGYNKKVHPKQHKSQRKDVPKIIEDSISIPIDHHGALIGKGGAKLRELEEDTGCQIDIPDKKDKSTSIWITGYTEDVEYAKGQIREISEAKKLKETTSVRQGSGALANTGKNECAFPSLDGQEIVVIAVEVEKFAHGLVIGKGGQRVKDLRRRLEKKEGVGSAVNYTVGVEVNIPDAQDPSSIISVQVPKNISEKAVTKINDFFLFYEIEKHLLGIKVLGDMSMQGDSSTKGDKLKQGKGAAAAGGSGGGRSEKAGKKDTHVDPSPPTAGGGLSREASTMSQEGSTGTSGQPRATVGTDPSLMTRKPRFQPIRGALIDRVKVNGYTHPVLPQRAY